MRSTPAGAKIYIGGDLLGVTPTGVVVRRTSEERLPITFEKLGYKPLAIYLPVRTWDSEAEARERPYVLERKLAPR